MKKIHSLLASVRGDTLVEALVALLIAALGTAALATMVMAATNIAQMNQQTLKAVYAAEASMTLTADGKASVSIDGTSLPDLKVIQYRSKDGTFVRYEDENTTSTG